MKKIIIVLLLGSFGISGLWADQNVNTQSQNVNVQIGGAAGGTYQEGLFYGEMMAKGNGMYFFSGCCLGAIGIVIPAVVEPKVPMEMVMGRSAEYIQGFRSGYIAEARSKNIRYAVYGCCTQSLLSSASYALIFLMEASYYYY